MFESLFGRKPTAAAPATGPALPLGLRLGGAVEVDDTLLRANAGRFAFEAPQGNQPIEALGIVDVGGGCRLYRFYVEDDAWYQVKVTSGQVDEIKLFVFADTINPPDANAFRQWVEPGSQLGQAEIEFAGNRYTRVWGDTTPGQWAPPIACDEHVTHVPGGEADFDMTHYSMLYQREVEGLPGRYEYLFVTAEDYGPNKFDVVYSLGTDVTTADLSIT